MLTAKATVRRAARGGVEERGTAVGATRNHRAPPRPPGPASCRVHFGPLLCRPSSFEGRLTPLSHRARPSPRPPVPLLPSFARRAARSFRSRPPSRARPHTLSAPALLRALVATPVPFPPSLARGRSGLRRIGDFWCPLLERHCTRGPTAPPFAASGLFRGFVPQLLKRFRERARGFLRRCGRAWPLAQRCPESPGPVVVQSTSRIRLLATAWAAGPQPSLAPVVSLSR